MSKKDRVARPESIRLNAKGNGFVLYRKGYWFSNSLLIMFSIICLNVIRKSFINSLVEEPSVLGYIFALPGVFVGLGIGYLCLGVVFNQLFITVEQGRLDISQKPFPVIKDCNIAGSEIERIEIRDEGSRSNNPVKLHAITKDNRSITLLYWLMKKEECVYLKHALEEKMGIG